MICGCYMDDIPVIELLLFELYLEKKFLENYLYSYKISPPFYDLRLLLVLVDLLFL